MPRLRSCWGVSIAGLGSWRRDEALWPSQLDKAGVTTRVARLPTSLNLWTLFECDSPIDLRLKSGLAHLSDSHYIFYMTQVAELIKEASKLDLLDRAELVSSLLEDLDPSPHYVTDEEALQRLDDLKSGRVQGMPEDEFWKACGRR